MFWSFCCPFGNKSTKFFHVERRIEKRLSIPRNSTLAMKKRAVQGKIFLFYKRY
jgi:hypothetical protein